MKSLAAALIIFSCGGMGLIIAGSYKQRVHHLRELIRFVQLLESEIHFARTTLPKLIAGQAAHFSGAVGRFLTELKEALTAGTGESFASIWDQGLAILAQDGLPPEVLEELPACGKVLGRSDAAEQSKHLKQLLYRLEQALAAAERDQEKHLRLWQYLGFGAGLLLVLLLV